MAKQQSCFTKQAKTGWQGYRETGLDLFLSTFENRIDKKGRLSVPAPYRTVLERSAGPLYVYKSLTLPCLEGCGPARIAQIVDAIDELDALSEDAITLQTILSSAQEMRMDPEGRMTLPPDFVDFADLDDVAVFAGIGRSFQIWHPTRYRERESQSRNRAQTGGLPKLNLSRRSSGEGT